jgi:hypothetical protein
MLARQLRRSPFDLPFSAFSESPEVSMPLGPTALFGQELVEACRRPELPQRPPRLQLQRQPPLSLSAVRLPLFRASCTAVDLSRLVPEVSVLIQRQS